MVYAVCFPVSISKAIEFLMFDNLSFAGCMKVNQACNLRASKQKRHNLMNLSGSKMSFPKSHRNLLSVWN